MGPFWNDDVIHTFNIPPNKCLYFKQPLKTGGVEGCDNPLRVEKEMENQQTQISEFLAGS